MRYALIDNSTLTAVQRMLGGIPIKNKYQIDADIVALENYIQAILLYDKLLFLDDYKDEHKGTRKTYFSNLLAFKPSSTSYNDLLSQSKKLTEDIVPCVQGGKITDRDFRPFFDLLKMNVTFTWDMNSSVYYLTSKMLEGVGGIDIDKYSKLATMIHAELQEKREVETDNSKQSVLLYDSKGRPISQDYSVRDKYGFEQDTAISSQVKAFFAGLNWLAFRTTLYTLAAKELKTDLILHPIRNAFQVNMLNKLNLTDPSIYKSIIDAMNGMASETFNKVLSITQPWITTQPLPMFTAWLANKTGDPCSFIEAAYDLRKEKPFVEARKKLIELEELVNKGETSKFVENANKLVSDIQQQMNKICGDYGVSTPQGVSISPIISLWNLSTIATNLPQVPEFNAQLKLPGFLDNLFPARGFKAIYKNLLSDLTQVSQLGKYHDIISSRVLLEEDATYYSAKTESIEYARAKSNWKVPM